MFIDISSLYPYICLAGGLLLISFIKLGFCFVEFIIFYFLKSIAIIVVFSLYFLALLYSLSSSVNLESLMFEKVLVSFINPRTYTLPSICTTRGTRENSQPVITGTFSLPNTRQI